MTPEYKPFQTQEHNCFDHLFIFLNYRSEPKQVFYNLWTLFQSIVMHAVSNRELQTVLAQAENQSSII